MPALTHWNHPGFFGYFAITASAPGVLAEFLSAALNQQAMLWRTSPAATELEEVTMNWLRGLMGLPAAFEGVIYDTASIATLHALAAAREAGVPGVREHGLAGRSGLGRFRVYCSEHAHSSVDKAVITARPRPGVAAEDRRGRRVQDAAGGAARRDRARPRERAQPDGRRRDDRHDVDHQRRSRASDRGHLRRRTGVAARRRGVRGRHRHPSRLPHALRRLGDGRLGRRQSAQVAVHAVRSQRVLLPPDGRDAAGVLARARVSCGPPKARAACAT